MVIWMYKESYLRFSSQEYSLSNHHESVHLTNHAVQKRYTNGKRDKRLPNENMWDCYSFQAYLRQVGKHELWEERIYPGMRKAIVGTMLASQENMDRRPNTFELFGADFMISEDYHPWLIEINSSPDLGATTSVTARMCPQCLEDVIKVVIDRRADVKADVGNFELVYRQLVPPTPAYMGLNLLLKGKQLISKTNHNHHNYNFFQRKERTLNQSHLYRQRTTLIPAISNVHRVMPTFNATEYIEKYIAEAANSCVNGVNTAATTNAAFTGNQFQQSNVSPLHTLASARRRIVALATSSTVSPCPNMLRTSRPSINKFIQRRRSYAGGSTKDQTTTAQSRTVVQPAPNSDDTASVPFKRFRSCGPRLTNKAPSTTTTKANQQSLKVIIQKCTIQKSQQSPRDQRFSTSPCNLKEEKPSISISSTGKENNQNNSIVTLKTLNGQISLRKQNFLTENKPLRHSAINIDNAMIDVICDEKIAGSSKPAAKKPDGKEDSNDSANKQATSLTGTLNAVGKQLRSWQTSRSSKPAAIAYVSASKSAKTAEPANNVLYATSSSSISTATRLKSTISPKRMRRRTRSEILCRNTRC